MSQENNPLKQYFRRPAIYIKLPSGGKYYRPETISFPENRELPVYPMTAIDEITARTPDALFNGESVAEIIKSCVPNIREPWEILNIDIDALLIAIRTATNGNKMEIESTCGECLEGSTYEINLVGLLSELRPGDYEKELSIDDLIFKFKPLVYKEMNQVSTSQFELQRRFSHLDSITDMEEKNKAVKDALLLTTKITIETLSNSIAYIKTPSAFVQEKEYILDFLNNCDKNVFEKIKAYSIKLKEGTEMKPLKIKCMHCQYEYTQPFTLNMSDFFG
jgi:hypothetical protein